MQQESEKQSEIREVSLVGMIHTTFVKSVWWV